MEVYEFHSRADNPLCGKTLFGKKLMTEDEAYEYADKYDLTFKRIKKDPAEILEEVSIYELMAR